MREPAQSIDFITGHDGFTLNDLVSCNAKHNEANGEGVRDGCGDNRSWNCGAEGASDDHAVLALRTGQIKNLLAINVLSLGTPMLLKHFALKACWEPLAFDLPALPSWASSGWRRVIDTSLPSPQDLVESVDARVVVGAAHIVQVRSVVVLFAGAQAPVNA